MLKKIFFNKTIASYLTRYSSNSLAAEVTNDKLSHKRLVKKPFIKTLISGFYDQDLLIYPELTYEKLKIVENKFLALPHDDLNTQNSVHQLISFSSPCNFETGNKKNSFCELTRLGEAVSILPLALLIEIHKLCVHQIISKYCSDDQKRKYLQLLKGEKSVAFALSEDNSGSDPSSITTLAVKDREKSVWNINGSKCWVTNGEFADFFLVFSKIKLHENSPGSKDLAVFIVDRKTPGVSFEKISSHGLEECGIGRINLKNVELSDQELIDKISSGYDIAAELLSSYKYSYASSFSSQLKQLIGETVQFISPRKQTTVDLKDCELIKKKLSDACLVAYVLDSMLYLTAGLMDNFEIDTTLESAIIHMYCIQHGIVAVENCLQMLGSRAYDKSFPYYKIIGNLKASASSLFSKDICKLYISTTGIQYAAINLSNDVIKLRNSFNFPLFFLKKMFQNWRHSKDSPKLTLNLYTNLHPSLINSCNQLEYCVLRIQHCVEKLLILHGSEITKRQLDLERVSDILVDIYGMTAVLSRSSRSYCTGVKFADDEVLFAKTFCLDASKRIKETINSILGGDIVSNDLFHFKLADKVFHQGGYFIEHPLSQNIS